jgi:hopanoid biosynthesis associated protein HpnK
VKRVILTGDDFGLAVPVNEAIEEAHRRGVLTAASLMVGAPAAADAVERARRLPTLRVGLHLVLVEGRPVLAPERVPDLVDGDGELETRLFRAGARFFFRPAVRRQLEAEIRAQFAAFRATGLPLDHVNAHNHMHLHPTVLGLVIAVGREHGLRAVRVPHEPALASWRAARAGLLGRLGWAAFLWPWMTLLKRRLRRAGLAHNRFVFGRNDSGGMDEALVTRLAGELPEGVSEIYFHLATRRCPEIERTMPHYRHEQELRALLSPRVRDALQAALAERIAFADLATGSQERGERC